MRYFYLVFTLIFVCPSTMAMKKIHFFTNLQNITEPLLDKHNAQTCESVCDLEQERPKTFSTPPPKNIALWPKLDILKFEWPKGIKREILNQIHDRIMKKTKSRENRCYTTIISAQAQPVRITDLLKMPEIYAKNIQTKQFNTDVTAITGKVQLAATYLEHSSVPKFTGTIFTSFIISALTLNATGERIAIAGSKSNKHTLLIYDLLHGKGYRKIASQEFKEKTQLLSFSPSAKKLLIASEEPLPDQCMQIIARIFSLETNRVEEELTDFDEYTYNQQTEFGWIDEDHIVARVNKQRAGKWFAPKK